jgi:hypothetical protein
MAKVAKTSPERVATHPPIASVVAGLLEDTKLRDERAKDNRLLLAAIAAFPAIRPGAIKATQQTAAAVCQLAQHGDKYVKTAARECLRRIATLDPVNLGVPLMLALLEQLRVMEITNTEAMINICTIMLVLPCLIPSASGQSFLTCPQWNIAV